LRASVQGKTSAVSLPFFETCSEISIVKEEVPHRICDLLLRCARTSSPDNTLSNHHSSIRRGHFFSPCLAPARYHNSREDHPRIRRLGTWFRAWSTGASGWLNGIEAQYSKTLPSHIVESLQRWMVELWIFPVKLGTRDYLEGERR